jgi:hypothetical protein
MHVFCSAFVHQLFDFHILLFQGNRVTVINAFTMTDMALCGVHIMVESTWVHPRFLVEFVLQSLVVCVCFVDRCLSFCTFSFGHCVVCSSSLYRLWIPLLTPLTDKLYYITCINSLTFIFCYSREIVLQWSMLSQWRTWLCVVFTSWWMDVPCIHFNTTYVISGAGTA